MAELLSKVCALCYASVAVAGVVQLRWPRDAGDRTILIGLALAVVVHAAAIFSRASELGAFPVVGLADGLSLFAFAAALLAIRLAWTSDVPQAAAISSVLVAAMMGLSVLVFARRGGDDRLAAPWLPFHITFAFLGVAVFAMAGIVAAVYLVQERRLKNKKNLAQKGGGLRRLPALSVLDAASIQLIKLGFPLLGLGLVFGMLHSKQSTGAYWNWNVLNTLGVLLWVLYALLLYLRLTIGWRGRRVALLTLLGIGVTITALVALSLSGWGAHGVPL